METITITRNELIEFCKAQAKLELIAAVASTLPSYHLETLFKALLPSISPPPSEG